MPDSDTVSSGVYQDLIQLTFLCGRGLPLEQLMERFLEQLRPAIPASATVTELSSRLTKCHWVNAASAASACSAGGSAMTTASTSGIASTSR